MTSKTVLSLRNLTKSYSFTRVVDRLNIELESGEAYGLIGPNGAGKTTTVKMTVGLTYPDQGEIQILGQDLRNLEVKRNLGFMPENPTFYAHLTAREFLKFIGSLFGLAGSRLEETINQILAAVGLKESADKPARGFSKGMRQRLGLAQSLINDPQIIILDEPLDGLDPLGRADIKELLLQLKAKGKTILLSSHILSDVEEICDRIGIIDRGRLIKEGQVSQLIPKNQTLEEYFVNLLKNA